MSSQKEWWHEFFKDFRVVFGNVNQRSTNAQVRYLLDKLALRRGRSFLDCPCGIGRITLPLGKQGVRVTAVDFFGPYLEEVEAKAKRRKLKTIRTVQSDMRRITFENEFDAAGNIWTSFGYFERESDNLLVLKKYFKALKPGGRFFISLINRDWVILNFAERDWFAAGDGMVYAERRFDIARSVTTDTWTFVRDGQARSHDTLIRIYSLHEMMAMLRAAGFVDIEGYGSFKEEPITRNSRMMYITAVKPKGKR